MVFVLRCCGWQSVSQSVCRCLSFQFLNFFISIQYWIIKPSIYCISDFIETKERIYYFKLVDILIKVSQLASLQQTKKDMFTSTKGI